MKRVQVRQGGRAWVAILSVAVAAVMNVVALGGEVDVYNQRLTRPLLPQAQKFPVQDAVFAALDAADRAADAAWGRLGSRAEYESYRTKQRQGFIEAMGGFDLPRTPLNAKVTETIAKDGYRIEKILFESRPGVYVTGLLFLPDAAKFKPPYRAYLVPCGHTWEGKGSPGYQRGGVMGALAGFAAFVYDPFAQGERMQPPAGGCCDGHNRYGALAELLGTSAARQRIWDGMRALDYLETRADIRKDGFGCMGNSGGGTESALLEVADPRIVAACPSCWISTLRDTCRACGPQDAEQLTFGQLAFGFNHASYVLSGGNAVRVHCNFEDFFPYSGTCETLAVVTNVAARCGLDATRYGMTDVTGPHAWKESSRTSSVQWMRRWLAGDETTPPIDVAACRKLDEKHPKGYGESTKNLAFDCGLPVKQALVTPQGQVSKLPGFRSIFEYLKDDLKAAEAARPKRTREALAKVVAARAGIRPLDAIAHTVREVARETLANGVTVVSEVFTFADGIPVPAVTFLPAGTPKGAVLVTDDRHRGIHPARVRDEMKAGRAIMVVDLAATGETGRMKHRFYNMPNADEETAMMLYTLGKSLVGVRAEETLVLADHLKATTGHPAEVVACGRTVISSAHAFAVRPDLFVKVLPFLCPQSWAESVRTSAVVPFANVVHGALKDYDWTDLLPPIDEPSGTNGPVGAKKLPKGYRPLAYIRSTGAQYIDTGYAPLADDEVSGRIEVPRVQNPLHNFATVFGSREGNAKNGFVFMTHVATPVGRTAALNRGANVNGFVRFPYYESVAFTFRRNSGWIQAHTSGSIADVHVAADSAPCGNSLYIFNLNVGAKGGRAVPDGGRTWISMKLFSFAIRTFEGADKKGRLVRDFVPCRDSSGRPGLWDRVGARFYANAGTGEFVGSDEAVEHIADCVSVDGARLDGKTGRVELTRFALAADIDCIHEVYVGAETNRQTTAVAFIPKCPVGQPAIVVGAGVRTTRRRAVEKALSEGRVVVLANLSSAGDSEAWTNALLDVASDLRRRFGTTSRIVAYGCAANAAVQVYAARRDLVAAVELIEPTPGTVREELLPKPADRLAKRVQAHALTEVVSLAGAWEMAYRAEPWRAGAYPAFTGVTVTNAVPGFWVDRVEAFRAAGLKDAFRINPMYLVLDYPITGHAYDMTRPDPCGTFFYRRKMRLDHTGPAVLAFDCVRNEVSVWINGRFVAFRQGFSVPFELAVPDGLLRKGENEIVLAVSNTPNFGYCDTDVVGMTTRGFFRSTGGIDGRCELRFVKNPISDVYVTTAADLKSVTVHVTGGEGGFDWRVSDGTRTVASGRAAGDFTLQTAGLAFWSPENPRRYTLTLTTPQGECRQLFGVRRLVADGEKLRLNGAPVYLRGVTEHCFFPRTIHLPRDLGYYRMITAKRKELGFNFVRFHTFLPPDEYFEATDELGMLVQVETPNFVTEDEFAAIVAFARRHPSVVIYCTGNETRIDRIAEDYLRHVAEMVHAGTDALFSPMSAMRGVEGDLMPGKDDIAKTPFLHNPKRLARLAQYCDLFNPYQQGLTSYFTVNSAGPAHLDAIGSVYCGKPLLAHEICIDGTFLDFSTEKLYPADSPVLKSGMFQESRRLLSEKGLLARSDLYFRNSNEWMRRQRKFTFEKIRASDRTAGYDFLGDINTQGVLYGYNVGLMDEFYRLKPGETVENVRRYNSAAVLLANFGSDFTVTAGTEKSVCFSVSNYERDFTSAHLVLNLIRTGDGETVWEKRLPCGTVSSGRLTRLVDCAVRMPVSSVPVKYLLKASLETSNGTAAANEWEVFGFPNTVVPEPKNVRVVTQISRAELLAALVKGERVLLFGAGPFKSEGMSFRSTLPGRNNGHVATVVQKGHPALDGMPHEGYCGWEFRRLLEGGRAVQLEGAVPFDPIVEMVAPERFPVRRAALFEYRVGEGRLLVSGFNVKGTSPEQVWLRNRLVAYAASDAFAPQTTLTERAFIQFLDVPRVVGKPNNNLANNPYDPSSVVRAGANAQP